MWQLKQWKTAALSKIKKKAAWNHSISKNKTKQKKKIARPHPQLRELVLEGKPVLHLCSPIWPSSRKSTALTKVSDLMRATMFEPNVSACHWQHRPSPSRLETSQLPQMLLHTRKWSGLAHPERRGYEDDAISSDKQHGNVPLGRLKRQIKIDELDLNMRRHYFTDISVLVYMLAGK